MSETKQKDAPLSYLEETGGRKGIFKWILSTDHKRIGLLYLYSIMTWFFIGVTLGVLMKLELIAPGQTIMGAQSYNATFTVHGVIMIFLIVVPGLPAVFGNFLLPIQIGAKDVAFPKLNLLSWYIYVAGSILVVASLFAGGGPPDTGWTFYAPYSFKTGTNMLPAVLGAFVLGFSSILTGLNFIVTIHRLRAPGMSWFKMPIFPWTLYGTAWIQLLATPIVGITLLMVIGERVFNIGFFDPAKGGDPILYQHLFWIYSHPAVYIMILPAMGAISEIIPTFAKKTLYGLPRNRHLHDGHRLCRLFCLGAPHVHIWNERHRTVHLFHTHLLVAIPSAIKVFNWVSTMYQGSIIHRCTLPLGRLLYLCLYDRRTHRTGAGSTGDQCAPARHRFCGGTLPFHCFRGNGFCVFRGAPLLVPEDLWPDVRQIVGQNRVDDVFYRIYHPVRPDVLPGDHRNATQVL